MKSPIFLNLLIFDGYHKPGRATARLLVNCLICWSVIVTGIDMSPRSQHCQISVDVLMKLGFILQLPA